MKTPTVLQVLDDPGVFGRTFAAPSWKSWRALLAAMFGLQMSAAEADLFRRCTARPCLPDQPTREAWLVVGRRGGKSRIAALVAVFLACFRDYSKVLAPGERGTVMVIAADRAQARVVFRYVAALIDGIPMLARLVTGRTAVAVHLENRVSIEVHTASFRAVRGYTIVAAVLDEVAYWRDAESANPDEEIISALRPGMATIPDSVLLAISSPYARRGSLWEVHRDHYGKDGDVLVWQATSRTMNPTLSQSVVDRAYRDDPARAAAEYGAEFRSDVEAFLSRDAVEACIEPGVRERPRIDGVRYSAFVDPSGGSSDSMTLAVAHLEGEQAVLDCVRERRPPFSPDDVVREFVDVLGTYRIAAVSGDHYAGEWPRERFREHGVEYRTASKTRSELYAAVLPAVNSRRVELLDDPRLMAQLVALERRTSRSGRDSIDHPPRAHDDVANAAAGALVSALTSRGRDEVLELDLSLPGLDRVEAPEAAATPARWRERLSWGFGVEEFND